MSNLEVPAQGLRFFFFVLFFFFFFFFFGGGGGEESLTLGIPHILSPCVVYSIINSL